MSTNVACTSCPTVTLTLDGHNPTGDPDEFYVILGREGHFVRRADFLAAVAAECDVIVIDRATLPEVIVDGDMRQLVHAGYVERHNTASPVEEREAALMHLALAEYLDAHPPVDEAQVEALAGLLVQHFSGRVYDANETAAKAARTLVSRGVRVDGPR